MLQVKWKQFYYKLGQVNAINETGVSLFDPPSFVYSSKNFIR